MRCLGRIVFLIGLLVLAGVAWLFRDDLRRWVDGKLHPSAAAARIGHPSAEALTSAMSKLSALQNAKRDSVILSADELATLLVRGTNFLPGAVHDSLSVELDDRAVRIRTVIDSEEVPAILRDLLPGRRPYEDVAVRGSLTPVRAGLAELRVEHVVVRGVPLPSDVLSRLAAQISGRANDGRFDVALPEVIGGFRVRPEGMTVYRQGSGR